MEFTSHFPSSKVYSSMTYFIHGQKVSITGIKPRGFWEIWGWVRLFFFFFKSNACPLDRDSWTIILAVTYAIYSPARKDTTESITCGFFFFFAIIHLSQGFPARYQYADRWLICQPAVLRLLCGVLVCLYKWPSKILVKDRIFSWNSLMQEKIKQKGPIDISSNSTRLGLVNYCEQPRI